MTTPKKVKPTPSPTPPQSPAAFAEAALASVHAEEKAAPAPAAKTVLVPAYPAADQEAALATKKALRELLDATPVDLARVFETPEAYGRYISARAEASKHV